MDWSKLKGKVIQEIEQPTDSELVITFTDDSSLIINTEGGHRVYLSEVTSDWVFDPLEISYRE